MQACGDDGSEHILSLQGVAGIKWVGLSPWNHLISVLASISPSHFSTSSLSRYGDEQKILFLSIILLTITMFVALPTVVIDKPAVAFGTSNGVYKVVNLL